MEIRGQSSSPSPRLTQFPRMQRDLFKERSLGVDSSYGFMSLCNVSFWSSLQTPVGPSQEGETGVMSAQEGRPAVFPGGFGNPELRCFSTSPIRWSKGSQFIKMRRRNSLLPGLKCFHFPFVFFRNGSNLNQG